MRQIKFRAWIYDGNIAEYKMTYSCKLSFFKDIVYAYIPEDDYEYQLNPSNITQFTGLLDKNGKEIYEGDIVIWPHLLNMKSLLIQWSNKECGFVADTIDGKPDSWIDNSCEIIGNRFENPELLEQ